MDGNYDLPIGAVAREAGVRTSAIRFYEHAGLLPLPARIGGQRRYDKSTVERLALIQFAQQAGFTVAEIRTLFEGFKPETPASDRWQILAREKLVEVDALVARAERMKELLSHALSCGCLQLDECARIVQSGVNTEPQDCRSIRGRIGGETCIDADGS